MLLNLSQRKRPQEYIFQRKSLGVLRYDDLSALMLVLNTFLCILFLFHRCSNDVFIHSDHTFRKLSSTLRQAHAVQAVNWQKWSSAERTESSAVHIFLVVLPAIKANATYHSHDWRNSIYPSEVIAILVFGVPSLHICIDFLHGFLILHTRPITVNKQKSGK